MSTSSPTRPGGVNDPVAPCPQEWLELECFGEDDRPVPGLAYEVELPDGTVLKGRLDGRGFARVQVGAEPAECLVRFPELDRDAWSPLDENAAAQPATGAPGPR